MIGQEEIRSPHPGERWQIPDPLSSQPKSIARRRRNDAPSIVRSAMAPTDPQEERGEGSRATKRRHRHRQRKPTEPSLTEPSPPSQEGKRKGSGDKKRKRDRTAASSSALAEHASSGASSAVSSPLRWPLLCRTVVGEHSSGEKIYEPSIKLNPRLVDTCEELKLKYHEKRSEFFFNCP